MQLLLAQIHELYPTTHATWTAQEGLSCWVNVSADVEISRVRLCRALHHGASYIEIVYPDGHAETIKDRSDPSYRPKRLVRTTSPFYEASLLLVPPSVWEHLLDDGTFE